MNNTVHYQWFDTAANGWLIEAGLLDIAHGDPIGLVVETGCRYRAQLSYPQVIETGLVVTHVDRSSVRYALGVFAIGTMEAAAEGHFVHVHVDRTTRRPVALPDRWRAAFETVRG